MVQFVTNIPTDLGYAIVFPYENMRSVRTLQEAVIKAARELAGEPAKEALLVLINPDITAPRLEQERQAFHLILRPDIRKRLHIVESRNRTLTGLPTSVSPEIKRALDNLKTQTTSSTAEYLGTPDFNYTISQILFHQYFRNAGPMTGRWLAQTTGCSYPTVAQTLEQFKTRLTRHSNRTFELRSFHESQWDRLLVNSTQGRHTIRYVDASGSPRSPENLFNRFQKLAHPQIAVGGTFAAAHAFPEFNLIGNPRLDLTIHCPESSFDLSFIKESLDPALKRADPTVIGANVVLHFVRRRESLFISSAGTQWADPVECLLDLADMRLVEQADQYYRHLESLRKFARG